MKNMKKTKGVKEIGKKEREKKAKLNRIIFGFVMAVILFVALITIENAVIKNEIKVETVVAAKTMEARTIVDEDKIEEYFKVIDLPEAYRPSDAISSLDELKGGIVTTKAIGERGVVTNTSFTSKDDVILGIEDPVEVSINLGAIEDAVAGKVRAGDIINILRVWTEPVGHNKVEYHSEYIFENAFVVESHTGTPAVSRDDKETSVTLITVYVPRDKELEIAESISAGTLRVGIVQETDGTEYIINGSGIATNVDTTINTEDIEEENIVEVVEGEDSVDTVEVVEGEETPVEDTAEGTEVPEGETVPEETTTEEGSETDEVE